MAKLVRTVFVTDPDRHGTVILAAGEEPEPRLAALVTNPEAWEDGKLPTAAQKAVEEQSTEPATPPAEDEDADDKPAAKRAATRPARGRKSAADEGSGS